MESAINQLAVAFGVDLSQPEANFSLVRSDQPTERWLIAKLAGQRIGVTRCQVADDQLLTPELDMVFMLHPAGWEPTEIVHAPAIWQAYVSATQRIDQSLTDPQGNFDFAHFADFWGQHLETQQWLVSVRPAGQPGPGTALQHEANMLATPESHHHPPNPMEAAENPTGFVQELRALQKEVYRLWQQGEFSEAELEHVLQLTFDPQHWAEKSQAEQQARKQQLEKYLHALKALAT